MRKNKQKFPLAAQNESDAEVGIYSQEVVGDELEDEEMDCLHGGLMSLASGSGCYYRVTPEGAGPDFDGYNFD